MTKAQKKRAQRKEKFVTKHRSLIVATAWRKKYIEMIELQGDEVVRAQKNLDEYRNTQGRVTSLKTAITDSALFNILMGKQATLFSIQRAFDRNLDR